MSHDANETNVSGRNPPKCAGDECDSDADLWLFLRPESLWNPYCTQDVLHRHPSLEVNAWLESGYARPVERGRPMERPRRPETERAAAFRTMVDRVMGWAE